MKKRSIFKISTHFILLFLLLALAFTACKKTDVLKDTINYDNTHKPKDFFEALPGTDALTNRVIANIKSRNEQNEFVQQFAHKYGYPVWNKVLEQEVVRKNNTQGIVQTNSTDTIILIPLVLDNETKVNGFIKATIHDSIQLSFSLAQDYKNYSFVTDNEGQSAASKFAFLNMELNRLVFDVVDYQITDHRLFSPDTITTKAETLRINPVISSANPSLFTTLCSTSTITYGYCGSSYCHAHGGGSCMDMGNCPTGECYYYSQTTTTCVTFETGSGIPGGGIPTGGGGGGGEIPPDYPCIPVLYPSVNADPLPPCPPPTDGTGWEPTPILTDPISNINDSMPNILARACSAKADSVFNWGLQNNNREQSFILVKKDGVIYAKNFQPGTQNGDKTRVNKTLSSGEQLVGYVHTHPLPTPMERSSFSPEDFIKLTEDRAIPGYTAILECGNVRYALVIEDLSKLNNFTSIRRNNVLIPSWREAIYSQPNIYSNGPQASVDGIIQYIGSASVCGVGFYRATQPNTNNFTKLNP